MITGLRIDALNMVNSSDLTYSKGYLGLLSEAGAFIGIITCSTGFFIILKDGVTSMWAVAGKLQTPTFSKFISKVKEQNKPTDLSVGRPRISTSIRVIIALGKHIRSTCAFVGKLRIWTAAGIGLRRSRAPLNKKNISRPMNNLYRSDGILKTYAEAFELVMGAQKQELNEMEIVKEVRASTDTSYWHRGKRQARVMRRNTI